jgi:glycosyltransferase involved in cell wall biosynthesis
LHLLFVDPLRTYGAETSTAQPLGGTQSAVTYLALALAQDGVGVTVANRRTTDVTEGGVEWVSLAGAQARFAAFLAARSVTHLVVVNAPGVAALRSKVAWRCNWLLWNHHWIDQPGVAPLADAGLRSQWDAVISVSEFHHAGMARAFGLEPSRHFMLRNAVSPHFERLFRDFEDFRATRAARTADRFIYTSAPYRGLDVLMEAWKLSGPPPDWSCTVVSGMSLYQTEDARFDSLLAEASALASMRCIEPVGQRALAQLCVEHDFWAYPCTQTETSCISAAEALAAGLYPLTTDRGALPETLGGFGTQTAADGADLARRWGAGAREQAALRDSDRDAWLGRIWEHRTRVLREWTWGHRAREWIEQLGSLAP